MSELRVYLGKNERESLKRQFAVSSSTVSEILNFKRSNKRASEVRSFAVNHLKGLLLTL